MGPALDAGQIEQVIEKDICQKRRSPFSEGPSGFVCADAQ